MDSLDDKIIEQIDAMNQCLSEHEQRNLYGAAPFWESLSEKHKMMIKESGFRKFKQTINFEYHQFSVSSLANEKIISLFLKLLKHLQIPYGVFLTKVDSNALADVPKIRPDFTFNPRLYAVFMGLLWQYALLEDKLGCLGICEEPLIGDPIPVRYQGRLISQDLATSAIELNSIARSVDLSKVKRVAEIGAGYGRFAYVAASTFPHMEYCIFDIPPALAISQNYLALTLGEDAVQEFAKDAVGPGGKEAPTRRMKEFLPHQLELFPDGYFDLVVNISSFDEMNREQVENYFSLIDRKCSGWLYIKGHKTAPGWCEVSAGGLAELPYKKSWKLVYQGKDPIVPFFGERIYAIHP